MVPFTFGERVRLELNAAVPWTNPEVAGVSKSFQLTILNFDLFGDPLS